MEDTTMVVTWDLLLLTRADNRPAGGGCLLGITIPLAESPLSLGMSMMKMVEDLPAKVGHLLMEELMDMTDLQVEAESPSTEMVIRTDHTRPKGMEGIRRKGIVVMEGILHKEMHEMGGILHKENQEMGENLHIEIHKEDDPLRDPV